MAMSDVENENNDSSYSSGQKEESASKIMHELISRGVLLDTFNSAGETALMIAAKHGKMKLVKN